MGLTLTSCQYLVFDECDRYLGQSSRLPFSHAFRIDFHSTDSHSLFEMGFAAELRAIMKKVRGKRQLV